MSQPRNSDYYIIIEQRVISLKAPLWDTVSEAIQDKTLLAVPYDEKESKYPTGYSISFVKRDGSNHRISLYSSARNREFGVAVLKISDDSNPSNAIYIQLLRDSNLISPRQVMSNWDNLVKRLQEKGNTIKSVQKSAKASPFFELSSALAESSTKEASLSIPKKDTSHER